MNIIQIIKRNHIDKIIVKSQNHENKVAHRVAHRVAHGPGPRFCPHPLNIALEKDGERKKEKLLQHRVFVFGHLSKY